MKIHYLFIFLLLPFFGYSQCPTTITTNGTRLFMNYPNTIAINEAEAAFAASPTVIYNGTSYVIQKQGGNLRYRNNPAAPNGTFTNIITGVQSITFPLTAGGSLVCNYEEGVFTTSALPVELISFKAEEKNREVMLKWSTASELNNRHFEIERSENEGRFETIGIVDGKGTTNELINYSFADSNIKGAQYYYRLKQVDFDGASEYSDIVTVKMNQKVEVKLFPSILKRGALVNIQSTEELSYKIYSPSLQLVKFDTANANEFTLDTDGLNRGMYSVLFSNGTVKRFVVVD